MEITFADFDRLQHNLRQATDDILRLQARVTALEGGAPLPADKRVLAKLQPTVSCEQVIATHRAAAQSESTELVPDISVGWVGGGRRS